jgi:hypothetical protein
LKLVRVASHPKQYITSAVIIPLLMSIDNREIEGLGD